MPTLREFLDQREQEIAAEVRRLRRELVEVRAARHAISEEGSHRTAPSRHVPAERLTLKDRIRSVLAKEATGVTSDFIIDAIEQDFGLRVPRSSLSPQLSRLKKENVVARDAATNTWRLVEQENAPPQDAADGAEAEEATTSSNEDLWFRREPQIEPRSNAADPAPRSGGEGG